MSGHGSALSQVMARSWDKPATTDPRVLTEDLVTDYEAIEKRQKTLLKLLADNGKWSDGTEMAAITALGVEAAAKDTELNAIEADISKNLIVADPAGTAGRLDVVQRWQATAEATLNALAARMPNVEQEIADIAARVQSMREKAAIRLANIPANIKEHCETVREFVNAGAPKVTREQLLANPAALDPVNDWLEARRAWIERVTNALAEDNLVSDITNGERRQGRAVANMGNILCAPDSTAADIENTYDALLQMPGPWSDRVKDEAKAAPLAAELVTFGLTEKPAMQLAVASWRSGKDITTRITTGALTLATVRSLLGTFGAKRALEYIKLLITEAKLSRFVTNRAVTPANFKTLLDAGDITLTPQSRGVFPYMNCRHHRGQGEAEAALDAVWTTIGLTGIWAVVHVHYCAGPGQPVRRNTNPTYIGFTHIKSGGNFGGTGGEVTDGPTKTKIGVLVGTKAI